MKSKDTEVHDFEEHLARMVSEWPSQHHESIGVTEECKEISLYDWGNGKKQIMAHYYVPIYGVGNSMNKARWEEVRSALGVEGESPLSKKVIGLNLPDWVTDEIQRLEHVERAIGGAQ